MDQMCVDIRSGCCIAVMDQIFVDIRIGCCVAVMDQMCVDIRSGCCVAVMNQPQRGAMLSCGTNLNKYLKARVREEDVLHHRPLQLCCPDVLSLVGDPLTGRRVWFTESHLVLVIFFSLKFYSFILFLI